MALWFGKLFVENNNNNNIFFVIKIIGTGSRRRTKKLFKNGFSLEICIKKYIYEIRNEKKKENFPAQRGGPHDTIFLLLKVAIRAAVVSLYNTNAAPTHNVATRRDCGRGVERAAFTGNNIYI